MAPQKDITMRTLDAAIEEVEGKIAEAKRIAGTIHTLARNLESLKRARSLLLGEPDESTPANDHPVKGGRPLSGSIGDRIMTILRQASKPMYISELLTRLTSQGVAVEMGSLSGILSAYVRKGWIARVKTGYYTMPRAKAEASPNGRPVHKSHS